MAERRKTDRREMERRVAPAKLKTTRDEVLNAAQKFEWNERMPNWTTIVDGHEYPARPLVLKAAKVSEKNPTPADQIAVILSNLGFEVRYKGNTIPSEDLPE